MARPAAVPDDATPDTLDDLLPSFTLSLRALGRSPRTVALYRSGVVRFDRWLAANGHTSVAQAITPAIVATYLTSMGDAGAAGNTVATAFRCLRAFGSWAKREGVVVEDPTARLRSPHVDEKLVTPLSDDELRRLFDACEGRAFADRRDLAVLRLLADSGLRTLDELAEAGWCD